MAIHLYIITLLVQIDMNLQSLTDYISINIKPTSSMFQKPSSEYNFLIQRDDVCVDCTERKVLKTSDKHILLNILRSITAKQYLIYLSHPYKIQFEIFAPNVFLFMHMLWFVYKSKPTLYEAICRP